MEPSQTQTPYSDAYHELTGRLRNDMFNLESQRNLIEARILLAKTLSFCIKTESDAILYQQYLNGYLTKTDFVSQVGGNVLSDSERYSLLYSLVNLEEAKSACKGA